jgi:hypothetical protein
MLQLCLCVWNRNIQLRALYAEDPRECRIVYVLHWALCKILARPMRRTTKLRVATVLLLLVTLLGGSAAISIIVTEVLLVIALIIALGVLIMTVVGPRFGKRRK